jgi:hypothetical protein
MHYLWYACTTRIPLCECRACIPVVTSTRWLTWRTPYDGVQVPVNSIETMVDWDFLELKVPCTYKLMGYNKQTLAPVPSYVPLETGREFRRGAATEQGVRGARGKAEPDVKPDVKTDEEPAPGGAEGSESKAEVEDKKGDALADAAALKMPSIYKFTPEALCHPTQAGRGGYVPASPAVETAAADPRGENAPVIPVGAGGRSLCRAMDSANRAQEGRATGKCMVYAPLLDHVETDLDFSLRVYPRVVGDGELNGSLAGTAGALGRALNPTSRGTVLDAAIFGWVYAVCVRAREPGSMCLCPYCSADMPGFACTVPSTGSMPRPRVPHPDLTPRLPIPRLLLPRGTPPQPDNRGRARARARGAILQLNPRDAPGHGAGTERQVGRETRAAAHIVGCVAGADAGPRCGR